ncbi:hypothetical protein VNO77_23583 [Canavalia gladiata]|uniref:mTERF protein n=1 Tax=Canavalia gladiata TaxID=3824 RepID=A0AAN9L5G7_CANGL
MQVTLTKRIIPNYKLVNTFLSSDAKSLASIVYCPSLLYSKLVAPNVKLLLDNGVVSSNIFRILRLQPFVICTVNLGKKLPELKTLGFDPSTSYFAPALLAKIAVGKSLWDEKIDVFKSWGWSEETILEAFRRQPNCMLASKDKINRDQGFLDIVWRAGSFQGLWFSKGLRSKRASLLSPFFISEKLFEQNFVKCFEEEETSRLLKLYMGKMNAENERVHGKCDMS